MSLHDLLLRYPYQSVVPFPLNYSCTSTFRALYRLSPLMFHMFHFVNSCRLQPRVIRCTLAVFYPILDTRQICMIWITLGIILDHDFADIIASVPARGAVRGCQLRAITRMVTRFCARRADEDGGLGRLSAQHMSTAVSEKEPCNQRRRPRRFPLSFTLLSTPPPSVPDNRQLA